MKHLKSASTGRRTIWNSFPITCQRRYFQNNDNTVRNVCRKHHQHHQQLQHRTFTFIKQNNPNLPIPLFQQQKPFRHIRSFSNHSSTNRNASIADTTMTPIKSTTPKNKRQLRSRQRLQENYDQNYIYPKPLNIQLSDTQYDLIGEQKKRALDVWEGVLRQGTILSSSSDRMTTTTTGSFLSLPSSVAPSLPTSISYDDAMYVKQQLLEGYVPPIFHAYTIKEEKRLYDPFMIYNTGVSHPMGWGSYDNPHDSTIRLTLRPAIAGMCSRAINDEIDPSILYPNIALSKSKSMIIYTTSDETAEHAHNTSLTMDEGTDAEVANESIHTNKTSSTLSFESDYMTSFINLDTGLAYEHVYDPGYIGNNGAWTFSSEYTDQLVHLINTPAEMVGEDIEVTSLQSNFGINPLHNDPTTAPFGTNLITRRLSRGVVLDCLENFAQRPSRTFAITGNTGIGKSYTMLFALQQLMLYEKMCVLIFLPKEQKAIICIRNYDHVYAWEGTMIHNMVTSSLFTNPNVFVLMDPLDAIQGSTKYAIGARRLIYAASNHVEHFYQPNPLKVSARKRHKPWFVPEMERYLSPYSEQELLVALPFMINVNETTLNDAMDRTYNVGMIPKYILNNASYQQRKDQVEQYVQKLISDPNEFEKILQWNGIIGDVIPQPPTISSINDKSTTEFKDDQNVISGISADDMEDDFIEVDGIVIGRIGVRERIAIENPMKQGRPLPQPPQPGSTKFLKVGTPLPQDRDGSLILSLYTYETMDRSKNYEYRTSSMIGYNGHYNTVKYSDPKMILTSSMIYDTLIQHYIKVQPSYIIQLWDKIGCGYHNRMEECVQDIFWKFVQHQRAKVDVLDTNNPKTKGELLRPWKSYQLIKGKENINPESEWVVPMVEKGKRILIDTSRRYQLINLKEIFISNKTNPKYKPMMVRMEQYKNTNNIIHFAGPGRIVYQIITDDDYYIPYTDMVKILVYGKYLLWQQTINKHHGDILCNTNPPPQKLVWYFIVPNTERGRRKWEQRQPMCYELVKSNTIQSNNESNEQRKQRRLLNRNKEELNTCIKNNVLQYVLFMDIDQYSFDSTVSSNVTHEISDI